MPKLLHTLFHPIKNFVVNFFPKNFPKRKLFPLLMMLFIEGVSQTSINSFVAYLLVDIGTANDLDDAGRYNGWLVTAFPIAQLLTSFIIGSLSDVVGRRPVLLVGTVGIGICNLLFGFSFNFSFVYIMRFLCGMLNGNIGVVKTYMGELTDDSNRAQTFNFIGLMWGIGSVIGGFLGGVLYDPFNQYPSVFGNLALFETFPALLPQIVDFLFSCLAFTFAYFFLTENPRPKQKKQKNIFIMVFVSLKKTFSGLIKFLLAGNWLFLYCCTIFFFLILGNQSFTAILPLILVASVGNGGFGYGTAQVGYFSAISSVGSLLSAIFFYRFFVERLGLRLTIISSILVASTLFGLFPSLEGFNDSSEIVRWILIGGTNFIYQFSNQSPMAAINAIVVNVANPETLGAANGVIQSFISLGKIIGPISLSPLFSWCLTNDLSYPLNQYFPFYLLTCSGILAAILTSLTPVSANKSRQTKVEPNQEQEVEMNNTVVNESPNTQCVSEENSHSSHQYNSIVVPSTIQIEDFKENSSTTSENGQHIEIDVSDSPN
ncbi:Major facilitator superfamily (MFS) profile domain-containing protein [Entamoeba marina]